jgi:hypothetical protein
MVGTIGHLRGNLADSTEMYEMSKDEGDLGALASIRADAVEGLHANVRGPLRCHFDDGAAPGMIRLHFARDEVITAQNGRATRPAPT